MLENLFSRRKGYSPQPVQGKLEELSLPARTRLWNIFYEEVFLPHFQQSGYGEGSISEPRGRLFKIIWTEILRRPLDEYPGFREVVGFLKDRFLRGVWHFSFDIFEMKVSARIKDALETENTAYTFLDGLFVERMTPQEAESVETALQTPIDGVRVHLTSALQKLSDRESPDYRNSIKESISAVEAACKKLTGQENATLRQALNALHQKRPLHQNLYDGLSQL
jgi:hypothetical protein